MDGPRKNTEIVARNHANLAPCTAPGLHRVTPFLRGGRVVFWRQTMVRDVHARSLNFDLDTAIQALVQRPGRDDPETVKLTGTYSQPDPLLG